MAECKFCKKYVKRPSKGYCISCYQYFILHNYSLWVPSEYGRLDRVTIEDSNQYNMPICHICGKAFTKLQQHIWYAHNLSKNEYCDLFGLNRNIVMTTDSYHEKMKHYAYLYDMDIQVISAGKSTRFNKGHKYSNYNRSFQTKQRLHSQGKVLGNTYVKGKLKSEVE